jgi:hypothetical protein
MEKLVVQPTSAPNGRGGQVGEESLVAGGAHPVDIVEQAEPLQVRVNGDAADRAEILERLRSACLFNMDVVDPVQNLGVGDH